MDRMTMNDAMDEVFNRRHAPRELDDSARNQLAELRHEACEDHCADCGHCIQEGDPSFDAGNDLVWCENCNG